MNYADMLKTLKDAWARGDYWCVAHCSFEMASQLIRDFGLDPNCPTDARMGVRGSPDDWINRLGELLPEPGADGGNPEAAAVAVQLGTRAMSLGRLQQQNEMKGAADNGPGFLKRLAAQRLARQYALEYLQELKASGKPIPDAQTVANEVVNRMKADGFDSVGIDWASLLALIVPLIQLLISLFGK